VLFGILLIVAESPIIITEVMSNVKGSDSGPGSPGDRNEYVEIYNQSSDTVDLSTYFIYDFDAPPDTICPWNDDSILVKYPGVIIHTTQFSPHTYALILDSEYCMTDTVGGYWQPYDLPDSVLILTTDETTIGDGLTTADPLLVFSDVEACTTSFGTPYDSFDYFPSDPGDGISWERIDLALPDSASNWHPSIDTSGCTPGRGNSVANTFDLAVDPQSIYFTPATATPGENVLITVVVKNLGLRETEEYDLLIFNDTNRDSMFNAGELLVALDGILVNALDSVSMLYTYEHAAQGTHLIGFIIDFPADVDQTNNIAFKTLKVVGEIGELALSPAVFSPNNDGFNDLLQIDYRLPEAGGKLTISVFDMRGIRIHDLCRDEIWNEEQGTLHWDGRTSKGDMPIGMYIIYLEYHIHAEITKAKKTTVLAR
jgi:hypothetical protein